jgi:ribosomal protein L19E
MADEETLKSLIKEIRVMRRDLEGLKAARKISASLQRAAGKGKKTKRAVAKGNYTVQYTVYADYSDYVVAV